MCFLLMGFILNLVSLRYPFQFQSVCWVQNCKMAGISKERYKTWIWSTYQKFKFLQTTVQLHVVGNNYYIFNCILVYIMHWLFNIWKKRRSWDSWNVWCNNKKSWCSGSEQKFARWCTQGYCSWGQFLLKIKTKWSELQCGCS